MSTYKFYGGKCPHCPPGSTANELIYSYFLMRSIISNSSHSLGICQCIIMSLYHFYFPAQLLSIGLFNQPQNYSYSSQLALVTAVHHHKMNILHKNKAVKLIGFLNCNLHSCSKELKELSYKQFVLPALGNVSSIWDPYHQNQINKLEMIQHRAAHCVLNQPWRRNIRDSISSRLSSLEGPTLQLHRESTHLILLYKIINHTLQIPIDYFPTELLPPDSNDTKSLHYQQTMDCFKYAFPRAILDCHQILFMLIHQTVSKTYCIGISYNMYSQLIVLVYQLYAPAGLCYSINNMSPLLAN